jgi:hypothetical protein
MRIKIYLFIVSKILKVPEGERIPDKYLWIPKILFPIQFMAIKGAPIRYDWAYDRFEIYGIQYSGALFRAWGKDGMPVGTKFTLISRNDGSITLQRELPVDFS